MSVAKVMIRSKVLCHAPPWYILSLLLICVSNQGNFVARKKKVSAKRNKHNAKKTVVDNIRFDSMAESRRYLHLKARLAAKEISGLELQPKFNLTCGDYLVCTYRADFLYKEKGRKKPVVEDYKGQETPLFRLKRKMFLALFGAEYVFRQSRETKDGYEETDYN